MYKGNHRCPIAIDEVKCFLAERDLNAKTRYIPKAVVPSLSGGFDEKIAIIGAGPAGLSCAYYLAQKGYKPTVFEKNDKPGGMLTYGIPSYKLEKDIIQAEIEVIEAMGAETRCGIEVGRDITLEELRAQGYKGFYIAIGCQNGKKPGIPGEDAEGAYTAVEFLRAAGEKESFELGGDVVIVGGGNVAIDAARTASRCGEGKVSLFCLESRAQMPATDEEVEEAESEEIRIHNGWGPKEVLTENGKVTGIVFKKCTRVYDAEGRFAPEYDENETVTVACASVIFSVGQGIAWGDLLQGEKVERRPNGGAIADRLTYQTAQPDIFVGGDVYTGPKFAIDAIAAGREGAISLHRFVHEHCTMTIGRNRRDFIPLDKEDADFGEYDREKRQVPDQPDTKVQMETFRDLSCTFSEDQVKAETSRCLGCGASVVDPNKCIGCGICTTRCMFDAIHLNRENPGCTNMIPSEDKLKYIIPNMIKQPLKIKFGSRAKEKEVAGQDA